MLYYLEFNKTKLLSINREESYNKDIKEIQEKEIINNEYLYNSVENTYKINIPDNLSKIFLITYNERSDFCEDYTIDSVQIIFDYLTIKDIISELITKNHNLNPKKYSDIKLRYFCQECIKNNTKSKCYKDANDLLNKYKYALYIDLNIEFKVPDNDITIIGIINIKSICL